MTGLDGAGSLVPVAFGNVEGRNDSRLSQRSAMSNNDRDFQALKETALSQLKAKHARRSVVLKDADGQGVKVVDAKRLTKIGSVQLLDQLVPIQKHNAEVDMMEGVHARLTKVEVYPPTVTIRYHHMSVETNALVGDKELPTLPHSVSHAFLSWTEPKRPLSIVHDASGILRPGRLTLILGPPSSGKTTFMKALVGRYRHSSDLKVTGSVTYNGKNFNEFMPERVASYVNQFDTHFGELTVRETIDFAAQCQSSSHMKDLLETVLAREKEMGVTPDPGVDAYMRAIAFGHSNSIAVEAIIRLLGLDTCSDTLVGNQMLRGISGGQRKRLGTGEVGVSQSLVLVADEISTGLDSNTTFNITNSLRAIAHIRRATLLVALLQPSPETYELFDDVILISGGLVCYHGPRESVADIFERFGLACPARKGVADFLQEVTTPSDQQKYWVDNTRAYEYVTASTIRDAYLKHPIALDMENELAAAYRPEPGALDLPTYKYAVSYKTLFLSNLKRTLLLQTRDKLFVYVRVFQICLMSVVVATLFLSTPKTTVSDGNIYSGAAFFSLVYMLIGGLAESHLLTMRLPVFYKQREMMFYPGWCFAVPAFIFRLPFCFVDATLWSCIAYFAVGFDVSSRFFVFWLLMFLTCAWATSLFQAIASVCRTDTIASAVGSFFLLVFIVTGGFVMVKSAIPPWWIGAYWANPWAYLTMSISINEFMGASWDVPNPADPTNPLRVCGAGGPGEQPAHRLLHGHPGGQAHQGEVQSCQLDAGADQPAQRVVAGRGLQRGVCRLQAGAGEREADRGRARCGPGHARPAVRRHGGVWGLGPAGPPPAPQLRHVLARAGLQHHALRRDPAGGLRLRVAGLGAGRGAGHHLRRAEHRGPALRLHPLHRRQQLHVGAAHRGVAAQRHVPRARGGDVLRRALLRGPGGGGAALPGGPDPVLLRHRLLDGGLHRLRLQVLLLCLHLRPDPRLLHRLRPDVPQPHARAGPGQCLHLLLLRLLEPDVRLPHPRIGNPGVVDLVLLHQPRVLDAVCPHRLPAG
ncbi:hypothetical protein ACKKBG_A11655 [Auxenochlorella protothecoides x Auxenochlorella symbiontica]